MDIIQDILDRVMDMLHLPDEARDVLGTIDRDVRKDWGGERVYIQKRAGQEAEWLSLRNASIVRDWRHGEHIAFLARKYGISERRIRQIIAEMT